jgi:anaerobic ribonucleoside-triphosphate reductase activating protein
METRPNESVERGDLLNIGFFHAPVVVLGPGRRVGMWLRGCRRHCPGCIAPELWSSEPSDFHDVCETFDLILEKSKKHECEGVTISGGEPFEQAVVLGKLIEKLKPILPDILIFSGFTHEEWEREHPWIKNIACLVDGSFEEENLCDEAWRGSANQKMIIYSKEFMEKYEVWKQSKKGPLQLARNVGRVLGIPKQKMANTVHFIPLGNGEKEK